MEIGLFLVATDQMMAFADIARAAEERGFAAIFTGEHSHLPVDSRLWSGGEFPDNYKRFVDPFVVLAHAAAVTTRIKLGSAVCLVALHDPILLAKTVATVDHVSGGRFVFGIGYGYLETELRDHGVAPVNRRAVVRENVLAMQELWSSEIPSYSGQFVSFGPCWSYPKPVQAPWPPILVGGRLTDRTIAHIIEFADGWIPTAMMGGESLASDITRLRQHAADAGRDPAAIEVTVFHTAARAENRNGRDWGGSEVTEELVERYRAAGATRLCLAVPSETSGVVLPLLDRYAQTLRLNLAS